MSLDHIKDDDPIGELIDANEDPDNETEADEGATQMSRDHLS